MGIEFRELVAVVFLSRTWLYYSTCLRSEYLQREGNMPVSAKTVQSVRSVGHQNRGRASSSRRVAAVASENTLGGVVFSLEKLVNEKLLTLHAIADEENDPQMADYIEGNFLNEQVEAIKKISDYVAQLRRVGEGHGVYHWDSQLE